MAKRNKNHTDYITLYWDEICEEGDVLKRTGFDEMNALWRLDFLKDVICELNVEYETAYRDFHEEMKEVRRNTTGLRKKQAEKILVDMFNEETQS